jgi:hypothetical protein
LIPLHDLDFQTRRAALPNCVIVVRFVSLVTSAALLVLMVGASGCSGGIPSPCTPSQVSRSGQVPSVQASPAITGVVGVLVDGHLPVVGKPSRIRWLVDARRAGPDMTVIAGRQDINKSFQQHVPRAQTSGSLAEYNSTLTFPDPGCWLVNVQTGPVDATVTFDVKKPT